MGGSVVTKSCPILLQNKYKIAGVAVLDVVEGSAVDALPHMNSVLNARPDGFDNVEEAIEWQWVLSLFLTSAVDLRISSCSVTTNTIQNVQSARISIPGIVYHQEGGYPPYQWRTPLRSTAPYWLSEFFILSFHRGYTLEQLHRLVPGPIWGFPFCSYSTPPCLGWHRSTGQGTDDWPNARQVPNGSRPCRGAHATRGA
jgi:hypothetical protein